MKKSIAVILSLLFLVLTACSTAEDDDSVIVVSGGNKVISRNTPVASQGEVIIDEQDGVITYDLTGIADSETALRNPDKGWYIHYYDNGIDRYGVNNGNFLEAEKALKLIPCLDHIYLRLAWSHLEPKEGQFNWELIDKIIDPYTKAGVGIAFRITCKETDKNQYYATPEWVKNAGAKGTDLGNAWEPDYGDPIFIQKLDNFHKAFAERYGDRENLVYVDIGSYGDWGEGHTASSSHKDWSWADLKKHFDIYKKYYKNIQVVVSDDFIGSRGTNEGKNEILQYVLDNGWTFRDDSISVKWFIDNLGTKMRSPELFDAVWEKRPTVLELEHYQNTVSGGTWRGGKIFSEAIEDAHATYGGFHGYPSEWVSTNIKYAKSAGNRMGYWYFINSVKATKGNDALDLEIEWENKGVTHAYNKYGFDIILTDKDGKDHVFTQKDFDNTAFEGDMVSTTKHSLKNIGLSGKFTLSVRMYKGSRPVYIAVDKYHTRDDGACVIGDITI